RRRACRRRLAPSFVALLVSKQSFELWSAPRSGGQQKGGPAVKNGFKVFDADAHVVYPADLWDRFLDKRYRHRVGRRAPAGLDTYNPVTVDGRWTQHPTSLYG